MVKDLTVRKANMNTGVITNLVQRTSNALRIWIGTMSLKRPTQTMNMEAKASIRLSEYNLTQQNLVLARYANQVIAPLQILPFLR